MKPEDRALLLKIAGDAYMCFRLVKQLAEQEGVSEALKTENQMEWGGRMNNIRNRAEKVVYNEIIY